MCLNASQECAVFNPVHVHVSQPIINGLLYTFTFHEHYCKFFWSGLLKIPSVIIHNSTWKFFYLVRHTSIWWNNGNLTTVLLGWLVESLPGILKRTLMGSKSSKSSLSGTWILGDLLAPWQDFKWVGRVVKSNISLQLRQVSLGPSAACNKKI